MDKYIKSSRKLTISSITKYLGTGVFNYRTVETPKILISGNWLQAAGFKIGSKVNLSVESGKIIITVEEDGKNG